jgi:hypothetical protein
MAIDETKLRTSIRNAAKRAFTEVRRAHKGETFYAFALYTDEGLMTVMPAANTEEGYARAVEKYGYTKAAERSYVRWATAEWAYEAAGDGHFDATYKLLNSNKRDDADDDRGYRAFANKVIGSMVAALRELDQAGFFGRGEDRERVTLFVSVSDSDAAEQIENASAKELNPPAVSKRFAKRYR